MIYTEKQRELLRLWQKRQLRRINLLEGSVSSGKTWVSLVLWAFWVASMPQSKPYLMCGRSLITLKRNCLLLLQELVGESNFVFSVPAKEGYLFGRRVFLEGANDARSESKIRGMTLQGAYCDELTQFPEDFFAMLLSRLRLPGAKLIATTNPDAPLHWLKAKYIDRADELDFLDVKFTLEDNTTLPRDYVENLKMEYTGVFYSRFILGNWTKAEGLVYPMFDMDKHVVDTLPERSSRHRYYVSVDYGVSNPFAAGLYDYDPIQGRAVKIKELYYKGGSANRVDNEAYYKMLRDFIGDYLIEYIIIDPSASSMIETIQKYGEYMAVPADNDVLNGIQDVTKFINTGSLLFYKDCVETFKEFGAYSWDEKKTGDAVIKENDHCLAGDTLVDTVRGPVRVDELAGKCGSVYCTDGERQAVGIFHDVRMTQREAEIFEVALADGRTVKATADHPILTRRGWVQIKDLRTDDEIACIGGMTDESGL